jgi:hypothetical protein
VKVRTSPLLTSMPKLRASLLERSIRAANARSALPWMWPTKLQDVIKTVMLKETIDGEFTTVDDVAETALFLAAFPSNALTGQSIIVSHGWFMQ